VQVRFRHIVRSVFSNWFGTAANMAVGFFLAPFVVHRLGDAEYGVWVLAISSVNYLGLLDLGMRSAVLRFVSKGYTVGDHEASSEALSAALWVRVQISALVLALSFVLAVSFPRLFHIQPDLAHSSQIAVMIIGLTTAWGMSMGVFGGVLSALNRYDLQSVVNLCQLTIRVASVVWVLRTGHGIVAIALCELSAAAVGNILLVWIARRIYPEIAIRWSKPKSEILRSLWTYSFYAFLTTIAVQLVYQTDTLIVGTFVSASAVTFYSIGNSLCRYTEQFVGAMSMTLVSAASGFDASGQKDKLRAVYLGGTRVTLALALPVIATLILRGRTFISLWMGAKYEHVAGTILILLAIPLLFSFANRTAVSIAFGIAMHKKSAKWAIWEGVANLALSVSLVRVYGIYGVAIGTMIPSLFVQLVLWPRYVFDLVGIRTSAVIFDVCAPMFLSIIPFAMASYAVNRYLPTNTLIVFGLQTLAILPVFLLTLALLFRKTITIYVRPWLKTMTPSWITRA
jgi:O-antigen/teichoic acid export membrane protein